MAGEWGSHCRIAAAVRRYPEALSGSVYTRNLPNFSAGACAGFFRIRAGRCDAGTTGQSDFARHYRTPTFKVFRVSQFQMSPCGLMPRQQVVPMKLNPLPANILIIRRIHSGISSANLIGLFHHRKMQSLENLCVSSVKGLSPYSYCTTGPLCQTQGHEA
jgi:hypothetical protein